MALANIINLGIKELRSIWRDPMMLVLIAFAFSGSVYTAAKGLPETLSRASIAIIDEDHSALSQQIADAFAEPYFAPPAMITPNQIDRSLDNGDNTFALDIPPDFQKDVVAGHNPGVQLDVDATRMTQAFSGTAYVQQIVNREAGAFLQHGRVDEAMPVEANLRVRFNPTLNESWFGGLMEVINDVTLLSIILTGAALIREREHGTIEHLLVMPVTPFEIMASKVWSMGLVVLVACGISLVLVIQGLLQVSIEGSIALFLLGAGLHLFATTSMGIYLATLARSMPQFALLMMLIILPLEVLSGAITSRESMPVVLQDVMLIAPTTHFVKMSQAVLYRGAGLDVVWPQFLAIIIIGIVFFTAALLRFRKALPLMA